MPTVRQYGPQQVSSAVQGGSLQSARTTSSPLTDGPRQIGGPGPMRRPDSPDSFGVAPVNPGAIGRGAAALGQGLGQLANSVQDLQMRIATTEAEEALVAFERDKNNIFFNPENGYFNSQGRDAYDRAKPTTEQLNELRRKYTDGLRSPESQGMFSQASEAMVTRADQDVMRHASTQFDAWEAATLTSRVENTLENASLYWNDPEQRGIQLELGRQSVLDIAMIKGLGPEAIAENLQSFNSRFASATIEAALGQSASAGQIALAANTELLEGPDLVQIQQKIDQKFKIEKTQRDSETSVIVSGTLISQYGDQPNARSIIIEEVNKIDDPDIRQATMRESMYQLDAKIRADSEARAAVFEAGEEFLLGGGSVNQFIAQNPEGWDQLTAAQKRTLQAGITPVTDYAVLSSLLLKSPRDLANVNPTDYFDRLAPADRQRLISAVEGARTGAPESQIGRTRAAETTSAVEQLFGESNTWGREDKSKVDSFYAVITAEVEYREKEKGQPLSSSEYTALLNDMTRKVVIEKSWWPDAEMDITEIPAEDMGVLSDYLRQNGYPVTSDNLIRAYEQARQ